MAKSKSTSFKSKKFSSSQMLTFALICAIVGGAISWAAFAAPRNGSGTITGPVMVVDNNANGSANFNDVVTFNVSTTATSQPYVNVLCYQNGLLVMNSWNGFFDQALNPTRNFGLYSAPWQSGAANCTANLDAYTGKGKNPWTVLASISFNVAP